MIFLNKRLLWNLCLSLVLVLVMASVAACASSSGSDATTDQETEHEESEDGGEHEAGEEPERIPNQDGAVIRITSPADGATFKTNEDIVVEVETENFTLGEEGRHWELFVGGASYASVGNGNPDEVLRGLEAGEYEISAFMSLGEHEQFQDGDAITITIEE